jgi:hypothetical protein
MSVHSALPQPLTEAVDAVLAAAGVAHIAHGDADPVRAAEQAVLDSAARALIGPFRSADVNEALAVTGPAGLALLAPIATWAGLTRADEPAGADDEPPDHRGTVLRLVARDTVVAQHIAADLRASGRRALVVAGAHDYGRQLAAQLALADLPRTDDAGEADVVVLCGLSGAAEIERAAALAPRPVIAFDGVQGADLGPGRDVRLALPFGPPGAGDTLDALFRGVPSARRGAELVADAVRGGAADRAAILAALRAAGPFDEHGDPVDPPVWLWRADEAWNLTPDRAL